MPTYEYYCTKCEGEFEVFQSISEKPLTVCPESLCCRKKWGKGAVKRRIGAGAGLLFKGSGFYITDYRSEGYKAAAKKESGGGEAKAPAKESGGSAPSGGASKGGAAAKGGSKKE